MKKLLLLLYLIVLTACGGSNNNHKETNNYHSNDTTADNLTLAERFFGEGVGTGETPSHIVPREDGVGFEVLSFGAWGNVYDLKESGTTKLLTVYGAETPYNAFITGNHLEFLTQQLQVMQNWTYDKDIRVADSTYTGPAIMYYMPHNPSGPVTESDYGTMQLSFGHDISNAILKFVMHNPANSVTLNATDNVFSTKFSEDRNDVVVVYGNWENNSQNLRVYHGYGSKR